MVTTVPEGPAAGVTEVTTGASLSASCAGSTKPVFAPAMVATGVGLPVAVSWLLVYSDTLENTQS